jgi:hypothetical protein
MLIGFSFKGVKASGGQEKGALIHVEGRLTESAYYRVLRILIIWR